MRILLLSAAFGYALAQSSSPAPDIDQIMSQVASNQAAAQAQRKEWVYNQKQLLRMVRGNGKVAREEQREYFSKRDPGMGDPDQGLAAGSERPLDDDRSGGTLFGPHEIIVIFRKSEVTGLGAISRREAFQHQRWVADDFALQALGNFSNREWH